MSKILRISVLLSIFACQAWGSSPALKDTGMSFSDVVKQAYVLSHMSLDPNKEITVSPSLESAINGAALQFTNERHRQDSRLSQQNCHVVCAMLGHLLQSGCKELVELYYYIVDSYQKQPNFLQSVTGYDWDRSGQRQANAFERKVYNSGNKMREFTCDLIHKRNLGDKNIVPWVHDEDGWVMHGAWSRILMNGIYNWQKESDPFWAFMLYQPLWKYFQPMVPEFMWQIVLDTENRPTEKREALVARMLSGHSNVRGKVWKVAWLDAYQGNHTPHRHDYFFEFCQIFNNPNSNDWASYEQYIDSKIAQTQAEESTLASERAKRAFMEEIEVLSQLKSQEIETEREEISKALMASSGATEAEIEKLEFLLKQKALESQKWGNINILHDFIRNIDQPEFIECAVNAWKKSPPYAWQVIEEYLQEVWRSATLPTLEDFKRNIETKQNLAEALYHGKVHL